MQALLAQRGAGLSKTPARSGPGTMPSEFLFVCNGSHAGVAHSCVATYIYIYISTAHISSTWYTIFFVKTTRSAGRPVRNRKIRVLLLWIHCKGGSGYVDVVGAQTFLSSGGTSWQTMSTQNLQAKPLGAIIWIMLTPQISVPVKLSRSATQLFRQELYIPTLGIQIVHNREYSYVLGPEVGIIYIPLRVQST